MSCVHVGSPQTTLPPWSYTVYCDGNWFKGKVARPNRMPVTTGTFGAALGTDAPTYASRLLWYWARGNRTNQRYQAGCHEEVPKEAADRRHVRHGEDSKHSRSQRESRDDPRAKVIDECRQKGQENQRAANPVALTQTERATDTHDDDRDKLKQRRHEQRHDYHHAKVFEVHLTQFIRRQTVGCRHESARYLNRISGAALVIARGSKRAPLCHSEHAPADNGYEVLLKLDSVWGRSRDQLTLVTCWR